MECSADGRFILSKPENTGGLISWGSAAEQVRLIGKAEHTRETYLWGGGGGGGELYPWGQLQNRVSW